ncbi:MAG: hypothetical protein ABSF98_07660 [Bryobacteraceae bacterium]
MTITIEITPRIQAGLAAQAAACGMDVPTWVAALLEQAAQPEAPKSLEAGNQEDMSAPPKRQRPPGRKSLAQLFAESPFKGLDIDFERDPDFGRDVEL